MNDRPKTIIEDLLDKPFMMRSYTEKRLIVKNGRPCPKLMNLKTLHKDSKKEYIRNFKGTQYALYSWLTGCENQLKLYCWPCLLFSTSNSAWNTTGLDNLNTLQSLQKKHKQSIFHLQCVLKLAAFEEAATVETLGEQISKINTQHNLQVKKNRKVLKRLIDVSCYLIKQDLPFNSGMLSNRDNYVELLKLLKGYDSTLVEHFNSSPIFSTSVNIQNDVIKAIYELLNNHIHKQLEQSEFITIMLDESSNIERRSQLSVVFRYCLKGKIYETFVGFMNRSRNTLADDVVALIKTLLEKYSIVKKKVVGLTCDGAVVMSDQLHDLQTKIKKLCPNILLVNCYAHVLNFVLSQGLRNINECNVFFCQLNGIATFTPNSNKSVYALKEYLENKNPSLTTTKWCFSSRLVNVVCTYREVIAEFFENIQKDDNTVWESKDRMAATGYCLFLESFETIFLLNLFSKLFTQTDILFDFLQIKDIDIVVCVNQIQKLINFLIMQKEEGFSDVWQTTLQTQTVSSYVCKIYQVKEEQNHVYHEAKYRQLFDEIIDNLLVHISQRFSSLEKFKYIDLLNGQKFDEHMDSLNRKLNIELYSDMFEIIQLNNELNVFYTNSEEIRQHITRVYPNKNPTSNFQNITPYCVLRYIANNSLTTSFEQIYKLSQLICTIPLTVIPEYTSALERIKKNLQNTQKNETDNYLELLSIEKGLLEELQSNEDFYDRVIENFLNIDYRTEFMLK